MICTINTIIPSLRSHVIITSVSCSGVSIRLLYQNTPTWIFYLPAGAALCAELLRPAQFYGHIILSSLQLSRLQLSRDQIRYWLRASSTDYIHDECLVCCRMGPPLRPASYFSSRRFAIYHLVLYVWRIHFLIPPEQRVVSLFAAAHLAGCISASETCFHSSCVTLTNVCVGVWHVETELLAALVHVHWSQMFTQLLICNPQELMAN